MGAPKAALESGDKKITAGRCPVLGGESEEGYDASATRRDNETGRNATTEGARHTSTRQRQSHRARKAHPASSGQLKLGSGVVTSDLNARPPSGLRGLGSAPRSGRGPRRDDRMGMQCHPKAAPQASPAAASLFPSLFRQPPLQCAVVQPVGSTGTSTLSLQINATDVRARECRGGFHRWVLLPVALLAGMTLCCSPTVVGPSIIRLDPLKPEASGLRFGVRSGPRPAAANVSLAKTGFDGKADIFKVPEWSLAYDLGYTYPIGQSFSIHAGVQAEFLYPIPFPGIGAYAGASYLIRFGDYSIAPALAVRGASDLGLPSTSSGGPSSFVGVEFAPTFSMRSDNRVWAGITPFVSGQYLAARTNNMFLFAGGVAFFRIDKFELSGGFGQAWFADGRSWLVPLMGIRVADN